MPRFATDAVRRAVAVVGLVGAATACSSGPSSRDTGPTRVDRSVQTAGGILRAYIGGSPFDLRIRRMSPRSDAGGPPPRCVNAAGPVQFDLNWTAANGHDALPKVTVSIATGGGRVLALGQGDLGCRPASHATFHAMPVDTQLVLSGALPKAEANVRALRVTIDGVSAAVPLRAAPAQTCPVPTRAGRHRARTTRSASIQRTAIRP
jgi:hypothetical protein